MPDNRLSNLGKDLKKAKQQALLIEVLQSDLESWADQSPDVFRTVCDASAAVFDADVKGDKTNVLMVGEEEGPQPSSIFGALLGSLDNEFDDLHKREILAKLAGFGLNQALGGIVGDAVGDNLNVGVETMMDYLAEWRGSASDFLASFFEAGVEAVAEKSGDLLETIGENGAEAIAGQFSSKDSIYLSRAARKRLKELAPRLSEEASSHETLQLALEMLLVTAQGAPKVIVVKDPLRLDDASLALLAMLVSLEKDLRQVNHAEEPEPGRAQTAGISVVLTFNGPQPHDTVENKNTAEKQRAISRLRMMASRYSLLERLDSDIPVPAVRSSTFVGRDQELENLRQHWNSLCEQPDIAAKQAWCLIKGEPGTGKTALANRVIQQIRSDAGHPARLRIPTLRMLNQTGHSAQATGLASLKNSMVDELRRLNLIYQERVGVLARFRHQVTEGAQRLKDDATSDDPEAKKRTHGRVGKVVSKLLGVDAAVGFAGSVKDWSKQKEMRSMREQEFGQSFQANHKEEQFELLREALLEMRKLAEKCPPDLENQSTGNAFPVLLLIDDLQWVDDFTAEFLLNEWPADMPVYILATARGSDSFTTTGDSDIHQAMNCHRNRLFSELGLIDTGPVGVERDSGEEQEQEKEGQQRRNISSASCLELKGMDQPMLADLIKLTYAGITKEQAEQFAAGVINNLAGENRASDVITLFAIETLNVISDPQFYRRNPELPRLIEPLPGTERYRFRCPENRGLTEALDNVFQNLTEAYKASYLAESGQSSGSARFNLASYAVMEERLHLIEQYFGEYGGTARYSLLFSALLGNPFRIGLVRHVLDDLKQLAPEEHPDLALFLNVLQRDVEGSLEPAQYELLERAYEIIRRLEESINRYVHQHSLLQQFLLGQLTQLMDRVWPELDVLEKGIGALVGRIEISGNEWFADQLEDDIGCLPSNEALETEGGRFLVALTGYWYQLMRERSSELGEWAEAYASSLNCVAMALFQRGRPEDALPPFKEALAVRLKGYESDPDRWAQDYAHSLNNLAVSHVGLGRPDDAVALLEEALSIRRKGYEGAPQSWEEDYAHSLNNLGGIHCRCGHLDESLHLLEEALAIRLKGYELAPDCWEEDCAHSLNSLALTLCQLGRPGDALPHFEKALAIRCKGYEFAPDHWAIDYAASLDNLAATLRILGRPEDALPRFEEALSIRWKGYEFAPERWSGDYAQSLNSHAVTLNSLGRPEDALARFEEALSIRRKGYELAPVRWTQDYAITLSGLAETLGQLGRPEDALPRFEEALSIQRKGYESAPERWAEDYATSLNNLGLAFSQLGHPEEALSRFKEELFIRCKCYELAPEREAAVYATSLNNLAVILGQLGRPDKALPQLEKALSIRRKGFELDPDRWQEGYATSLKFTIFALRELGRTEKTLALQEELLSIQR
jgi:tetratricopeptide (TPR) repeat protein